MSRRTYLVEGSSLHVSTALSKQPEIKEDFSDGTLWIYTENTKIIFRGKDAKMEEKEDGREKVKGWGGGIVVIFPKIWNNADQG
jgi:hypothetical protein